MPLDGSTYREPSLKQRWISALRSGQYKQTFNRLHDSHGFCGVGVLYFLAGILIPKARGPELNMDKLEAVQEEVGGNELVRAVIYLNDEYQVPFTKMADIIEKGDPIQYLNHLRGNAYPRSYGQLEMAKQIANMKGEDVEGMKLKEIVHESYAQEYIAIWVDEYPETIAPTNELHSLKTIKFKRIRFNANDISDIIKEASYQYKPGGYIKDKPLNVYAGGKNKILAYTT
jgi:hypothetical protein